MGFPSGEPCPGRDDDDRRRRDDREERLRPGPEGPEGIRKSRKRWDDGDRDEVWYFVGELT